MDHVTASVSSSFLAFSRSALFLLLGVVVVVVAAAGALSVHPTRRPPRPSQAPAGPHQRFWPSNTVMESSNSAYARSSRIPSTMLPSPPSPSASSPGLTQSASNSSSSPPQPITPPRQSRPRYPDLGRVPLHRRGTSQTYERLEDLLREAGYKETRIFTPESDRLESRIRGASEDDSGGRKSGVGAAVVGFLTGLVTGGTGTGSSGGGAAAQLRPDQDGSDNIPDQRPRLSRTQSPSSPLANKYRREGSRSAESSEPQTPFMTSSIESLGDPTPKAYRRQPPSSSSQCRPSSRPASPNTANAYSAYHTPNQRHHVPNLSHLHQHQLHQHQRFGAVQKQASRSSISIQTATTNNHNVISLNPSDDQGINNNIDNNANVIHHPRPSRAGTYLRHMVSTPTITPPSRPNSTPVRYKGPGGPGRTRPRADDSDMTDAEPPLPRKWLDNVARAILLGVAITPLGSSDSSTHNQTTATATTTTSHLHPHQQRTLRATRSSISQTTKSSDTTTTVRPSGLRDQTNLMHTLAPPALFTRLERERAPCSQGQVSKAQVVCRSAPGSRSSSLTRTNRSGALRDRRNEPRRKRSTRGGSTTTTTTTGNSRGRVTRRKKPNEEKTRVPSLARTRIEGDAWRGGNTSTIQGKKPRTHYFLDHDPFPYHDYSSEYDDQDYDDEEEEDEEDDDDGELDLAKMLVNPKRQQSIRSLRKHLNNTTTQLTSPSVPDMTCAKLNPSLHRQSSRLVSGMQTRIIGMQEGDSVGGWEQQWRSGGFSSRRASEDDEQSESLTWLNDDGTDSQRSTTKTRLGLPGPWSGGIQGHR